MVFEYTDYRLYLKSVLAKRIAKNPRYSLRAMAKNLAVSPALLSQISNGQRNLTPLNAVRFSKKLGLSRRESDYFCSLVQYQDAKHMESKAILQERIQVMRRGREVQNLSLDAFQAVSDWYHFAILEMLKIEGFKAQPKTIAKRLGISAVEAEVALERLIRLGAIQALPGGGYKRTMKGIRVESADRNQALQSFHRQMLEKAAMSLGTQSPKERHIGSETFSIDLAQIPEAQKRINEFLDEMAEFFARAKNPTETYHLGVQLFRLTRKEES
jgi:uncharacterized protein (TIGR02147 family)